MIFKFELDGIEVAAISEALAEMPYKKVSAVIVKMQAQINTQLAASAPSAVQDAPAGSE